MRWFLVDRFLELVKGSHARAVKNVTLGEDHIHDYFPGYPMMPPSLLVESMAQTGGILAGCTTDFKEKIILAKVVKATFPRPALPGDQVLIEAVLEDARAEGSRVSARATVNGETVAEGVLMFVNLDSFLGEEERSRENFVFTEAFLSVLRAQGVTVPDEPDREKR